MDPLPNDLVLDVAKDGLSAELTIPRGFDPQLLSDELCLARFSEDGVVVEVDPAAMARITAAVAEHKQSPNTEQQVRVEGRAAAPGKDGRLELTCRPNDDENGADRIDFYSQSPFILVQTGQMIGRIIPPQPGEDGINIRGELIAPKPGKTVSINLDDSIRLDPDGSLIAQTSGTLEQTRAGMKINQMLAIEGFVDFQTGHINFDGDVTIEKGVRDRFMVETKGSVVVNGLVEGATCIAGLDATFMGGMAAKDKGIIKIGRNCRARYLNEVEGIVGGDLFVDREIINCHLQVSGEINSPGSSVIGGEHHALRQITVKEVGSQIGVRTVIHLGSSPRYEQKIAEAKAQLAEIDARLEHCQEQAKLLGSGARGNAQAKERLTQLQQQQAAVQAERDRLAPLYQALVKHYRSMRDACLTVQAAIYPGTIVAVGRSAAMFNEMVRGPIVIEADRRNQLIYRHVNQNLSQPIRLIARPIRLNPAAATADAAA